MYSAIVIFTSDFHVNVLFDVGSAMMRSFLNIFKSLYGSEFFSSNVHNLIHLAEEVSQFGTLNNFNTLEIVALKCVVKTSHAYYLYGFPLKDIKDFFEIPITSKSLFIYASKQVFAKPKLYSFDDVSCKLVCLPYAGDYCNDAEDEDEDDLNFDYVFVPLWHTLKKE